MTKKYKNKAIDEPQSVSEPTVSYQTTNKLTFYKSFEEASLAEAKFILTQSPVERLRQTVELILRVYNVTRESLKERKSSNRIRIIRKE